MKVITAGHKYELASFEGSEPQTLQFIEKRPVLGTVTLETVNDGTTNEEVLEVLIDRLNTMNSKVPSRETSLAITKLEEALGWMERRTKNRKARNVEGTMAK
jgi:hypothetical protein